MQTRGYMLKVIETLKDGEFRQFPLSDVNPASWRVVASRVNKQAGWVKYSVTVNGKLGLMAIKHNINA